MFAIFLSTLSKPSGRKVHTTSTMSSPSPKDLADLAILFPNHSQQALKTALIMAHGNLAEAVDSLLASALDDTTINNTQTTNSNISNTANSSYQQVIPSSLRKGLRDYVNNERFADVQLEGMYGATIHTHSPLLWARSVIFESLLLCSGDKTSNNKKILQISDASQEDLLLLLQYLYTDSITGIV